MTIQQLLLVSLSLLATASALHLPRPVANDAGDDRDQSQQFVIGTAAEGASSSSSSSLSAGDSIWKVIKNHDGLQTLSDIIKDYPSLVNVLNSTAELTLFAPNNDAFKRHGALPRPPGVDEVLRYHVVAGEKGSDALVHNSLLDSELVLESLGGLSQKLKIFNIHGDGIFVNHWSKVVKADIAASNGVIHIIDRILTPPSHLGRVLLKLPNEFSVLLLALKRANLYDDVKEANGITVFAPTNRAFRKLGFRRLRYLFSDAGSNELKSLLLFHATGQITYSSAVPKVGDKLELPSLHDGNVILLKRQQETDEQGHVETVIEVNGEAHVVWLDVLASNGVIHGIDHVLSLPIDMRNQWYDATDVEGSHAFEEVIKELGALA